MLSRNKPLAKGAFQVTLKGIPCASDVAHIDWCLRQGFGRRIQVTVAQPLAELSQKSQKVVGGWLLVCSGMAVGSIILGGVTRQVMGADKAHLRAAT